MATNQQFNPIGARGKGDFNLVATAVGAPTTALADGQLYGADFSGNTVGYYNRIAYAENATGITLALINNTLGMIMGCSVVVPAGTQPVVITAGFDIAIGTTGTGVVVGAICDSTGGTAVVKRSAFFPVNNLTSTNAKNFTFPTMSIDVGTSNSDRVFGLYAEMIQDTSFTASVRNNTVNRSWIEAVGR